MYRNILAGHYNYYTGTTYADSVVTAMVGIYMMNEKYQRCSPNTLFDYLQAIHRQQQRKKDLLSHLQLLKREEMIQKTGRGAGTHITLRVSGLGYLFEIEGIKEGESLKKLNSEEQAGINYSRFLFVLPYLANILLATELFNN